MSYYQKYLLSKSKYLDYQGGSDTRNVVNIHFKDIDGSTLPILNGKSNTSILEVLKFIREQTGKDLTSIGLVLEGKDIVYNSKFRDMTIGEITDKNNIVFYLMSGTSDREKLDNLIKDFPPDVSVKTEWLEKDILVELDLAYNGLNEIPDSISTLENLEKLDLSDNNLKRIPNSLGELEDLQDLNLSSNRLKNIPDTIGNLSNLEILDISFNDLVALPDSIGNLSKLRMLYMYDNKNIQGLPESLDNLKNLEDIKIGDYDSY